MNCPRCIQSTDALATEKGPHGTVRRRYQCAHGHPFTTVEVYEPQDPTIERKALGNVLRAINTRFFSPRRAA